MPIIKVQKRDNPYVMVDHRALSDARLSWKAKGLLAYLLSKPSHWEVVVEHLMTQAPDKKIAIRSALAELKKCGYARMETIKGENNQFGGRRWIINEISETPDPNDPERHVSRLSGVTTFGKPATSKEGLLVKKDKSFKEGAFDIEEPFDSKEFLSAWADWIAYRKEAKMKPWTERTIRARFADFEQAGEAATIAAIRESIGHGWQGIFLHKHKRHSPVIEQKTGLTAAEIL